MADFKLIQDKWQKRWADEKIFKVFEKPEKKKFYCLEMFPYPSAAFLHMGHVRNYSIGDSVARFKRMSGFNVLYPMGFDSFGLPAENASKKANIHPREYTENAISKIVEYMKALGLSYDWTRMIATHKPEYYKWNQYFFIKFFEKGLAYRAKASVNFCEHDNTVLANEEVVDGKCWRCDNPVVQKELDQWFLKTTAYADSLLEDLNKLEWSGKIKAIQENWIGKSYGVNINFHLDNKEKTLFPIFTTRPDTIYGVTFMVIALDHPKLKEYIKGTAYEETVHKFVEDTKKAEIADDKGFLEKSGVFTGLYAINPLNNDRVPIYAGNFVVADYASGMIMAVPAHDQRDYEFAKKYGIPIKQVVAPYILGTGINAPREHSETVHRKTITAIVEHWNDNKFLVLKEPDNYLLVGGGVEKGETPKEAASRELKEETGYLNFEIKRIVMDNLLAHGHRISKNINQISNDTVFHIKLLDGKRINSEEDIGKHKIEWVEKKDLINKITFDHHKIMCELFFKEECAYVDSGVLVDSEQFNGLEKSEAIDRITEYIENNNLGRRTINYKLKDWLISRQRYWGTPIPMIHCDNCGVVPVPIKDLPVLLPDDVDFSKTGNPLLTSSSFKHVECPKCKSMARRETDTMGGFMDSSWYFLRYCSPDSNDKPFDKDAVNYWMPVDQYVGGIEHAVGHLIYSRFFVKVLRDMGMLDIDEPFNALFNQGVVHKDNQRMSKSHGNIVTQDEISRKYGIDTARMFMLSVAGPDKDMEWSDQGVEGTYKTLNRIYKLFEEHETYNYSQRKKDKHLISKKNIYIKRITDAINDFKQNNAVLYIIEFTNYLYDIKNDVSRETFSDALKDLALLLNPFAPHLSEECYEMITGADREFASLQSWPEYNESFIDNSLHYIEDVVANTIKDIYSVLELAKIETPKNIDIIISSKWKYELIKELKNYVELTRKKNIPEIMKHMMSTDLKIHGQEIMKSLPKIIDRLPEFVIDQNSEYNAFIEEKVKFEEEFKCSINISLAENSKEAKAKQSMPGKPAIIVS